MRTLSPYDFGHALRDLLRTDLVRTHRPDGWAPSHTRASDAVVQPAHALVQLALNLPLTFPDQIDLNPRRVRPIYPALTAYALARSSPSPDIRSALEQHALAQTSSAGFSIQSLLYALTLVLMGRDRPEFDHLLSNQKPTGHFLDASPYDSPDLHWYDELVTLHALASYHAMYPSPALAEAIHKAALYHLAETQPDHATTQPWALHAFAAHPETRPLADLLLHGTMAQNAGHLDGVARVLIADAVIALTAPT
jgi:hypothetical protein